MRLTISRSAEGVSWVSGWTNCADRLARVSVPTSEARDEPAGPGCVDSHRILKVHFGEPTETRKQYPYPLPRQGTSGARRRRGGRLCWCDRLACEASFLFHCWPH